MNQYLWYLEWLKIDKERQLERYMAMNDKAISPKSSLDIDGTPYHRDPAAREKLLTNIAAAWDQYFKACDKYEAYRSELLEQFGKLDYSDRMLLEYVYIWNLDRPYTDRKTGLCRSLDIRKRDIPARLRAAKEHLRELLISQGTLIDEAVR